MTLWEHPKPSRVEHGGGHRSFGGRLEPPPEGAVPAAVLDAGRLRVLPQRHGTDGAVAARLRRAEPAAA
jgi:hypothetical protein